MVLLGSLLLAVAGSSPSAKIDRRAVVSRHHVTLTAFDGERPLQVGNGEFAFGMDVTGLQTFAPFNTMSHWGWHSGPAPKGQTVADFEGEIWDTHGRAVRYPSWDSKRPELSAWLMSSPHRINLGRVGLLLTKRDGTTATRRDLKNPKQRLDLWSGVVTSRFEIEGVPVTVKTAAHPKLDAISVHVESPLVKEGRLAVFLACPGNNPVSMANFVGDWSNPGKFEMAGPAQRNRWDLVRRMDEVTYHVGLTWQGEAALRAPEPVAAPLKVLRARYGREGQWVDVTGAVAKAVQGDRLSLRVSNELGGDPAPGLAKSLEVTYSAGGNPETTEARENENIEISSAPGRNRLTLQPVAGRGSTLAFTCAFSPKPLPKALPVATKTFEESARKWPAFWRSGGAVDFSQSRDPRWRELERRVVLSQYLMEVNEAGSLPPQESGLVNNGWYGRLHLEMVWWHAAHYALWNRWPQMNRGVGAGFYLRYLESSRAKAKGQGFLGARWPKCIGPNGVEWPHPIHAHLLWQQPHPIFFAELDYRAHPTKATLEKWRPIVEATADFMASFAYFDERTKRYVLGPPMVVVSENTETTTTQNPTFELGYWRFGLRTAQEWRKRLGLPPRAEWAKVQKGLSPLPTQDGLYVLHEGIADMWTKFNFEHPAITGAFGMLPGDGVDRPTMRRTLDKISKVWQFERTWGWDFPMLAMNAARLGETDRAVDFLLHPASGFQFDARGLATGGPFPYFPSNGGLLYAVAMMAGGWDGAPKGAAPGFPAKWKVRVEGLAVAP